MHLPRIMVQGFAEGLPRWRTAGGVSWRRRDEGFVLRSSRTSVLRAGFASGDHQKELSTYIYTHIYAEYPIINGSSPFHLLN